MFKKEPANEFIKLQKQIGRKIQMLRMAKGIKNYEKFAIKHGFGRSHYWRIEAGEVNLTLKTLSKILNSLNVKIEDFFKDLNS